MKATVIHQGLVGFRPIETDLLVPNCHCKGKGITHLIRLTYYSHFVAAANAGEPILPSSLEDWLANDSATEIGGDCASTDLQPTAI
jgi:hypothetical protein